MTLILASLACWRLTSLLVYEDGPGEVFSLLRGWASEWTKLLDCFWCASVWVAIPIAFVIFWPDRQQMAIGWLAISAGAIMMDELLRKGKSDGRSTN